MPLWLYSTSHLSPEPGDELNPRKCIKYIITNPQMGAPKNPQIISKILLFMGKQAKPINQKTKIRKIVNKSIINFN